MHNMSYENMNEQLKKQAAYERETANQTCGQAGTAYDVPEGAACGTLGASIRSRPNQYTNPREWAHEVCRHHSPTPPAVEKIAGIRAAAEAFLIEILRSCPSSQDRQSAIESVRLAMMHANASIALDGLV